MTKMREPSPLLRLPPELRNRIYHELFCSESTTPQTFHLTETSMEPSILSTCTQLLRECTGIFYANTTLQFTNPEVLIRRLTTLPSKTIDLIPEIRYDTSETCVKASSWRTAFRELPGLDEDTKLEGVREELRQRGVNLRVGVLKARIVVGCGGVWSSDPLSAALDAVKQGEWILCRGLGYTAMLTVARNDCRKDDVRLRGLGGFLNEIYTPAAWLRSQRRCNDGRTSSWITCCRTLPGRTDSRTTLTLNRSCPPGILHSNTKQTVINRRKIFHRPRGSNCTS